MSDLPPSRRDEREAELVEIEARHEYANARGTWSDWRIGALVCRDVPWLIGEVRSLSQQLNEAKADSLDAERYRVIRDAFVDVKWGDMPLFRPATLPHAKYVKPDDFDAIADSYIADAKLDPFAPASPRA